MGDHDVERIMGDDSGEGTARYVRRRLAELAAEADTVIDLASRAHTDSPDDRNEIYREAWWELHLRLGQGSIGPATSAAAPLLNEKQTHLAARLGITDELRDAFEFSAGRELPGLGAIGRDIESSAAPVFWAGEADESLLLDIRARLGDTGEATVEPARRFPAACTRTEFEEAMHRLASELDPELEVVATGRLRVILRTPD